MKKFLFLDDARTPRTVFGICAHYKPEDFDVVTTYDEFINYIKENSVPDFISFDHDLGYGKNGYDCAKWLVEFCIDNNLGMCFDYYVHSANPVGKKNIIKYFEFFEKHLKNKA